MTYAIGQFFGILAALNCLVLPLFRRKRQMLLSNAFGNSLFALNLLLIGQPRSLPIYAVAIVQVFVMLWLYQKGRPVTKGINLAFLAAYVACGLSTYARPLDLLPVIGAVFNMLSTFQPDEQKTRYFLLANTLVFALYFFLIRSTSLLSSVVTVASTLTGICKCRKK